MTNSGYDGTSLLSRSLRKLRTDGLYGLIHGIWNMMTNSGVAVYIAQRWARWRNPVSYRGVLLDVSNPTVADQIPRIFYQKYEAELVEYISKFVSPELPVVEFGGGMGFVACYIDQQKQSDVSQVVVEPNPEIHSILHRNRLLNDATFDIEERAYSATSDEVLLQTDGDFTQASTSREKSEAVHVSTISLADIQEKYDLDQFALIVDMEGAEAELIREEMDLIQDCCPVVMIEYHPFSDIKEQVADARRTFESGNYKLIEERGGHLPKSVYLHEEK